MKKKIIILLFFILIILLLIIVFAKKPSKLPIIDDKVAKIKIIERNSENAISKNDLIQIGNTEQFYVIDTNENETTLIAKYNLYVGAIYSVYNEESEKYYLEETISSNDSKYGLQNELAIGNRSKKEKTVGGVYFSSKRYWVDDNNKLLSKYGTYENKSYSWTKNNIYDNAYSGTQSSDYSVAYYIKEYVRKLNDWALTDIQGRILSLEELNNLGCHVNSTGFDCKDAPKYITNSSYWISTAYNDTFVYTNQYEIIPYNGNNRFSNYIGSFLEYEQELPVYSLTGVRPVIIIKTSYLNNL